MIRNSVFVLLACTLMAAPLLAEVPLGLGQSPAAPQIASNLLLLEDAVREALQKNPAVQSSAHMAEAQRRRVPQAGALPDPNFGLGWMGNATPFSVQQGDPSSYRSLSAMQMLPFPGKRKLRAEVAGKEADAAQWELEAVRRRVTAEVKAAYYDYFFYSKAVEVTNKNKDLLSKLSQISEARYRVGRGIQADVLKSQVEVSMLLQKLTTLEQMRQTAQARLNALLARDPEAPLPPPANVQQAALSQPLESLYALARANDTEIQREQRMIERNQLAASLARREYYPDLSVGYMYQQRPIMPDMHGLTFTINVPVFYKSKQREAVRQATQEMLSARESRNNRQNELYFELKQQYLAAKASDELLRLFAQAVVPQSSLALESSMSAYQTGTADFLTVLANFNTVVNYETDYYRELANYQSALARMESLIGVELTNQPPAPATSPTQKGSAQ
jgi:outer membrane protein TolC